MRNGENLSLINIDVVIENTYKAAKVHRSDVVEHLDLLKELASQCQHVTEFGVRYVVSTWALLAGCKRVVSYDIAKSILADKAENLLSGSGRWTFIQANVLNVEIDPTDFLFIDTTHTYKQLSSELALHSDSVTKYIAIHDTEVFGLKGEDGSSPGMLQAIDEFVAHGKWKIMIKKTNCNGLVVLEREQ